MELTNRRLKFFLLPEHQLASLAMEGWRLLLSQFLVALASSVGAEASDAARWRILLETYFKFFIAPELP